MNKLFVYPPDDLLQEITKRAKENDRSLSYIAMGLMRQSLNEKQEDRPLPEGSYQLAPHLSEKMTALAAASKKPAEEILNSIVVAFFKERERQREKNARMRQKNNQQSLNQ